MSRPCWLRAGDTRDHLRARPAWMPKWRRPINIESGRWCWTKAIAQQARAQVAGDEESACRVCGKSARRTSQTHQPDASPREFIQRPGGGVSVRGGAGFTAPGGRTKDGFGVRWARAVNRAQAGERARYKISSGELGTQADRRGRANSDASRRATKAGGRPIGRAMRRTASTKRSEAARPLARPSILAFDRRLLTSNRLGGRADERK